MPDHHDTEAMESAVIGAILADDAAAKIAVGLLDSADFLNRQYGIIFDAVAKLVGNGSPINIETIRREGPDIATDTLLVITEDMPDPSSIEYYCGAVATDSRRRTMDSAAADLRIRLGQGMDAETVLAAFQRRVEGATTVLGGGVKTITVTEAAENPDLIAKLKVLIVGLIFVGRVTLLVAREKLGKTTLLRQWAAELSLMGLRVLVLCLEDSPSDTVQGILAAGGNNDLILIPDGVIPGHADVIPMIEATRPDVVFIDTLPRFMIDLVSDLNDASQVTKAMTPIVDYAHINNISIVFTHHATKAAGESRGSTAITATPDVIATMKPDKKDPNARWFTVVGRGVNEKFMMVFNGEKYSRVDGSGVSTRDRVAWFIRDNPGCSLRAVRGAVHGRNDDVDDALESLLADGEIEDRGTPQSRAYYATSTEPKKTPGHGGARSGHGTGHGLCQDGDKSMGQGMGTVGARSGHTAIAAPSLPHLKGETGHGQTDGSDCQLSNALEQK